MSRDLETSLSLSARKQYKASWNKFANFIKNKLRAKSMPCSKYNLALYVTHLAGQRLKTSSIRSNLSAIAFFHKVNGHKDPTKSFLISKLLLSYTKRDSPQRTRQPLTQKILRKLVSATRTLRNNYTGRLLRSLFTLMYHAGLRSSEVCHTRLASHTLQLSQVQVLGSGSKQSLRVSFTSYKHSMSTPTPLNLNKTGCTTCPVRAFKAFLRSRGTKPGPAFIHSNGAPVLRQQVVQHLQSLLRLVGIKASNYNTHSFRIGKATDMASKGYTHAQIAIVGRWKSNAFLKYIKPTLIHATTY